MSEVRNNYINDGGGRSREGIDRSPWLLRACFRSSSLPPGPAKGDTNREREMAEEEGSEIEKRAGCLLRGRRGREGSAGKRGNGKRKHFLGATSCGAGNPSLSELIYV